VGRGRSRGAWNGGTVPRDGDTIEATIAPLSARILTRARAKAGAATTQQRRS